MNEMEPTAEQKKEWIIEALEMLGYTEQDQYLGMYSIEQGNVRSVVDLTVGRSTYLYDISKRCRVDGDDESGTLAALNQIIDEAETGAMPAMSEPDMVVGTPRGDTPSNIPANTHTKNLPVGYTPDLSIDVIKKYINDKATDEEAYVFLEMCKARNLNPFLGDAYLVKYDHVSAATMIVGKGALLKRAQAHPMYNGLVFTLTENEDILEYVGCKQQWSSGE